MPKIIELHPGDPGYEDDRPLEEILDEINDIANLASSVIGYQNHRLIQEDLNTIQKRYDEVLQKRK